MVCIIILTFIPTDKHGFHYILVQLIHAALRQREKDKVDERDWVVLEAMSGRKLQNGGTFRNVLARCIDEVITPYFAEIISQIDMNCNLDLLDHEQEAPLSRFWLAMFGVAGKQIDLSSLAEGKTTISTNFQCQLPFFWCVKDIVEVHRMSVLG